MKRSRTSGLPYFVNLLTMEPRYLRPVEAAEDPSNPLPPGWEVVWSRSTGAVYYFHADSGESMYTHPATLARVEGARTPPRRGPSPTRLTTGRSTDSTEEAQRQKLLNRAVWDSLAVSPASPATAARRERATTPERSSPRSAGERSSPRRSGEEKSSPGGPFGRSPIAERAVAAGSSVNSSRSPEWGSPMYR